MDEYEIRESAKQFKVMVLSMVVFLAGMGAMHACEAPDAPKKPTPVIHSGSLTPAATTSEAIP